MTDKEANDQTDQSRPAAADDVELHCPNCRYNLTGLSEQRCPECGRTFDLAQLRRIAREPPCIAFERASGFKRIIGFALTWLTVMFLPWVFARQTLSRIGAASALAFAALCFAFTLLSFFFDADLPTVATWVSTAVIYLVFQTTFLTLIEPSGWRFPLRTSRFWALIGCYTSAVMCTEFMHGPPLLFISEVVNFVLGRGTGWFGMLGNRSAWLSWTQIGLWLLGLACCFFTRMRRVGADRFSAAAAASLVAACLFLLYGATVEYVGANLLHEFFGGSL